MPYTQNPMLVEAILPASAPHAYKKSGNFGEARETGRAGSVVSRHAGRYNPTRLSMLPVKLMNSNRRKLVLLAAKILLAAVLVAWVLGKAHWHDFVLGRDGGSYSVIATGDDAHVVRTGALWWSGRRTLANEDIEPLDRTGGAARYRRPGFLSSLRGIRIVLLVAAAGGFLLVVMLSAARWWFVLRVQEIRVSPWEAVRLTFLGQFFNHVVPGTVGGDLVKAYYAAKHTPRKAAALMSVLVDRVLGLAVLTLIGAAALATVLAAGTGRWSDPIMRRCATAIVVVIVGVVVATAVLMSPRVRKRLHLQKLYARLPVARHIGAAGDAARLFRRRWLRLARLSGASIVVPVVWITSLILIGRSLSLGVPWYVYFLYIPLIYIIGSVPLTPGGVGWVENLYLAFFAATNPNGVLAFALLARLIPMFWALPGLVVALTGARVPKVRAMEAELGV